LQSLIQQDIGVLTLATGLLWAHTLEKFWAESGFRAKRLCKLL